MGCGAGDGRDHPSTVRSAIRGHDWCALERIDGTFPILAGVAARFENRWLLLAGWVHLLGVRPGHRKPGGARRREERIAHWMVIPCLLLAFLFGPIGLVLCFFLRLAKERSLRIA